MKSEKRKANKGQGRDGRGMMARTEFGVGAGMVVKF